MMSMFADGKMTFGGAEVTIGRTFELVFSLQI
jgi:hypothetical protein